jgi:hypothetical protein
MLLHTSALRRDGKEHGLMGTKGHGGVTVF